MKTITKTYNVYTFDELNDDAQANAHSEYLRNGDAWPWSGEAVSTIKEVEKLFHIKLRNWSIGSYRPDYPDIEFDDWWYNSWNDASFTLKGNRARSFLWNRFGHVLTEPRHAYRNGKCVKSRVFTTRVYDGTCPLTGVCFDCDALDPMAYFCFGVEWNEQEKKLTQTKDRTIRNDNRTTVESIVCDCVYDLFRALNADCEHCESREYFAEECVANGWIFTEDGTMMND